jgi:hypothetical protein
MHANYYAILALDLAAERVREAEAHHRYHDALSTAGPGLARRSAARAAASVSRVSAAIARRLDDGAIDAEPLRGRSTPA